MLTLVKNPFKIPRDTLAHITITSSKCMGSELKSHYYHLVLLTLFQNIHK